MTRKDKMFMSPPSNGRAVTASRMRQGRGVRAQSSRNGFSLVEILVTLSILVGILVVVLTAFDLNSKVARAQVHVAEMQQSLRVGQYQLSKVIRYTGRGGLPAGTLPAGLAIQVETDIDASTFIKSGVTETEIVPGTDVLTVRGVFEGIISQANPATALTLDLGAGCAGGPGDYGQVVLNTPSPAGVPQDLGTLSDVAENDALFLMSPIDDSIYAVVEIEDVTIAGNQATICFKIQNGDYTTEYLALSAGGGFPSALTTVSYVGVLEEYRYYIRKVHAIAGDSSSDLTPTLAVARFYPGTEIAYDTTDSNLYVDIVDNVFDLQIAMGIDLDADGIVEEDATDPDEDEWLFNHKDDDPDPALWVGDLYYLRVNTLARTDRRDLDFISEPLTEIEDREYNEPAVPGSEAARLERGFRRWQLQTVVDLRNLS